MLEQMIQDAYDQLAAGEQPPARVSVQGAIERARARRLRRWLGMLGTPALAASATLAVVLTGAIPFGQPGARPRRPPRVPTAQQAPLAPRRFNPLVPYAAFGWLPAGEVPGGGETGRLADILNGGHDVSWQLTVYAEGQCTLVHHLLSCEDGPGGQKDTPVLATLQLAGHSAYWSGSSLAWRYARGGWAVLSAAHRSKRPTPAAIEVASRVTFGAGSQPVQFDVQLTRVPANWRVSATSYGHRAGVLLAAGFSVTRGAAAIAPGDGFEVANLPLISAGPASTGGCYFYPGGESVRRMLNGHRVVVTVIPAVRGNPPSYQVCAADAEGLWVFVSVNGWHPVISPVTLFTHLRILGTTPANWTSNPIQR